MNAHLRTQRLHAGSETLTCAMQEFLLKNRKQLEITSASLKYYKYIVYSTN